MALRLQRLQISQEIVSGSRPSNTFQLWWARVAEAIERAFSDIAAVDVDVTAAAAAAAAAQASADAAQIDADAAQTDASQAIADAAAAQADANQAILDAAAAQATANAAAPATRNLAAGAGLTGGGTLAADRTFNVGAGTGITVNADDVALTILTAYGRYTPAVTNLVNVDATTMGICSWLRVGDTVTVSGAVDVDPTAIGPASTFEIALPGASNFSATGDCGGTIATSVITQSGTIFANTTNDTAQVSFKAVTASNATMAFQFSYSILP